MSADAEIRIGGPGGIWLSSLGDWGDLVVTHRWPLGPYEMTWGMTGVSGLRRRPPQIQTGAVVELFAGSLDPAWVGVLTQPDWSDGTFVAQGDCRVAESIPAMTTGLLTTSVPNAAVDYAIAQGWWPGVTRPGNISSVAYTAGDDGTADATDDVNMVGALLDSYTADAGLRWAINNYRQVYATTDPTTPMWDIATDTQALGVTSETLAGTVVARYQSSQSGARSSIMVGTQAPVVAVDLTGRGYLTLAQATALCNTILTQAKATIGFTNPITVTPDQISHGGVSPHPALVRAGQRIRLLGQRDPRGPGLDTGLDLGGDLAGTLSVVVGESIWTEADNTLTLSPVDTQGKDLASIVEAIGGSLVSSAAA